jgi:hypothetical protein
VKNNFPKAFFEKNNCNLRYLLRNPINKIRYRYVIGNIYFQYLASVLGIFVGIVFYFAFITSILKNFIPFWADLLILLPISWVCVHLLVDVFLKMTPELRFRTVAIGCITCYLTFIGFSLLSNSNTINFQIIGIVLLVIDIIISGLFYHKVIQVRIYPNRIQIGKLILYYQDMIIAKWGEGKKIIKNLNERQQQKPLEVLSPLIHEEHGKDFTIYHYYIIIEMANVVYVAQPVYFKSSFVQNIRNGWIETWRWDGTTIMPEGWIKTTISEN